MKERRMFERFKVDFPVTYVDLKNNVEGRGTMIDISAGGGGMIITKNKLEPDVPLEMKLHVPNSKDSLTVNGDVVWSMMVDPDLCRVGIRFEKVDFLSLSRLLNLNPARK